MTYEVRDHQGISGPYALAELTQLLNSSDAERLEVRLAGTSTWHPPSYFAELRRTLPTHRPPPPESGTFAPVAPLKTVVRVRAPHAAPRLCAAIRQR